MDQESVICFHVCSKSICEFFSAGAGFDEVPTLHLCTMLPPKKRLPFSQPSKLAGIRITQVCKNFTKSNETN